MSEEPPTQGNEEDKNPITEPLLPQIDGPSDLHDLDDAQLQQVAQEMRTYIIDTIGEIGGHFGANLGTCELAVALHSLLDSPRDKVLWDVGTRPTRTRSSPVAATGCRRSASTTDWRRSARSSSPSTTSWAPATPRPRSATRSG
jgi:hypothetical protein